MKEGISVLAPGTWNKTVITADSCKLSFSSTTFDTKNSSLFLNHEDKVDTWVGYVKNIRLDEKTFAWIGDLEVMDETVALKLEKGAPFGISPTLKPITVRTENVPDNIPVIDSFDIESFSIVIHPAMETNYINSPTTEFEKKESKEESVMDFEVWTQAEVNDLPDSAFMFIKPGGEKDADGKTVPRSLRALPVKNKDGKWDLPHVRNALARINQVEGLPAEEESRIRKELEGVLERAGKGEMSKEEFAEEVPAQAPAGEEKVVVDSSALIEALNSLASSHEDPEVCAMAKALASKLCGGSCETDEFACKGKKSKKKYDEEDVVAEEKKRVEFQKALESTRDELKDVLGKIEVMSGKLNEHKVLLNEKDLLIAKLQDELKNSKKAVAKFEDDIKQKELEKKMAWFNEIFDRYCSFHEIEVSKRGEVRGRLLSMSDDTLGMIDGDIKRALFTETLEERDETHHSAQLNAPVEQTRTEAGKGSPIDELFGKMQSVKN